MVQRRPLQKKILSNDLSVGEMSKRAGVPVSTLHYYETEKLIQSWRTDSNHRRYDRRELRRVAIIRVAQGLGIPLSEIREVLAGVPHGKSVSKADWQQASELWQAKLNERMRQLERLRDQLDSCIGCGCLSLEHCPLYNPSDRRAAEGAGPRTWLSEGNEK